MTDLSNVPTDENGIPTLTPEEMIDLMDRMTDHQTTDTVSHITDSIDSQIESLENRKYKSSDPGEMFREIAERKAAVQVLERRRSYWGSVFVAAVSRDIEARNSRNPTDQLDQYGVMGEHENEFKVTEKDGSSIKGAIIATFLLMVVVLTWAYSCGNSIDKKRNNNAEPATEASHISQVIPADSSRPHPLDTSDQALENRIKNLQNRVDSALNDPYAVYNRPIHGMDLRGKPRTTIAEKEKGGFHRYGINGNVFNDPSTGEVNQVKRYLREKLSGMGYEPLWWSDVTYYYSTSEYAVRHKYRFISTTGSIRQRDQVFVFDSNGILTDIQDYPSY